jgi:hypothetical protein
VKPFNPDSKTKQLLAEAACAGAAMARVNAYATRDPEAPVYPDRRWEWVLSYPSGRGPFSWENPEKNPSYRVK